MPISQETKDQIDDLATDIAALETGKERRQEINAALTNYAEKLEEKDKEIEGFKEAVQNLHDGYDICKSDYQKVIAKYKAQLESKDRELAQLKEIAEKMANEIKTHLSNYQIDWNPMRLALTVYAEWCKQNLK